MKILYPLITALLVFTIFSGYSATLQEIYNAATPGMGYDKLLRLNGDSTYQGGVSINNQAVGIKGSGAVIDLQGSSISVTGQSTLEIDGCVIINGANAIDVQDDVFVRITHCTFYQNQTGISFMATSGMIEVKNTIIANNNLYGFTCEEYSQRVLHYIDAYQNAAGNYMEWCET